ncbi:Cof-type HAD-IIB family hydrolase [Paenibacillus validus]|uniref:Cof-type HAD-IIB family hydrolase n=1 Tax=Paenibacillus validus TaxID=44253 RepID=A0A7X2ZCI5_9BACL|nr:MULTISPECIES: Cof-type HAD-IIB family hydrolase [Paenibacillus]MED4601497.1 Cof-type HAD-IIB family hydrolase [Paenibacillus validus]MED4606287.1 Cof-type HAD-IIB family hydrolase [Paenibacillus validus]MUG72351.1 Cof-type HAD-IIB family hydrolase [Paenibacillus validus]
MYKLLALDMDGTLLDPQKMVTLPVQEAVQQLVYNQIHVTLASGRFPASVWLHGKYLGLKFPLIALNGAVILDPVTGEKLFGYPISREIACKIATFVEAKGSYIHYYGYNVLYVNELTEMNRAWPLANVVMDPSKELTEDNYRGQVHLIQVSPVGPLSHFLASTEEEVYKATVIDDDPAVIDRLYKEMSGWEGITLSRTGRRRFDINLADINKKTALMKVCSEYNIASKQVVTIGDYDNDIEMLDWAGLGIAMGNGNDNAKGVANVITDSNADHGVATAIRQYFELNR